VEGEGERVLEQALPLVPLGGGVELGDAGLARLLRVLPRQPRGVLRLEEPFLRGGNEDGDELAPPTSARSGTACGTCFEIDSACLRSVSSSCVGQSAPSSSPSAAQAYAETLMTPLTYTAMVEPLRPRVRSFRIHASVHSPTRACAKSFREGGCPCSAFR